MSREVIVRYNEGENCLKIKGGIYICDLIRCEERRQWARATDAQGFCEYNQYYS